MHQFRDPRGTGGLNKKCMTASERRIPRWDPRTN